MANSSDIAQSDLAELLNVLGMGDHARPQSPHEVFQEALRVLRARVGNPAPNSTRTAAAESQPDELTETEIRARAAALISAKGWAPGETLHFKAVLDLMTEHGMAVASNPPQDRCAHPACGCDADSVCGAALAARPEAPSDAGWSQAARDVLAERRRQVEAEGWDAEHDDAHGDGDLAAAAACYALASMQYGPALATRVDLNRESYIGEIWPWQNRWWKPTTPRRDLVKAGALLLAEIERHDRLPTPPSDPAPSGQAEG